MGTPGCDTVEGDPADADAGTSAADGVVRLVIVVLALAGLRAAGAVRAWHVARGDRLSATEMLVWLR